MEKIIYGTAWKKERTKDLVCMALNCGLRAIDTACQPKHYNEAMVGLGIKESGIPREQIFIQTKFTSIDGQDLNSTPYNRHSRLEDQVAESIAISCKNLQTDYIDSYLLHSPMSSYDETVRVWNIMEQFYNDGVIKNLGMSNCYNLKYMEKFYSDVKVHPRYLQNRFYEVSHYDQDLRRWCDKNSVLYQSFWSLSANPKALAHNITIQLAKKYNKTVEQILFRYLTHKNIIPLTGTTNPIHMREDLDIFLFELISEEILAIDQKVFDFS